MNNSIKAIATALVKAQLEMDAPKKSGRNPMFKSEYSTLLDILNAVKPPLNNNGIALIQTEGRGDNGAFVDTILLHAESGEELTNRTPIIQGKVDSQGYIAGCTYARKNGITTLLGVAGDPHLDDDGQNDAKNPPEPEVQRITKAQSIELARLCALADMLPTALCEKMGIKSFEELEASKVASVMNRLQQIIEKRHDDSVKQEAALGGDGIPEFDGEA